MASGVYESVLRKVPRVVDSALEFSLRAGSYSLSVASVEGSGPKHRIVLYTMQHGLTADEQKRMYDILRDWPRDQIEQGLSEELTDILAARELSKVKPLTLDDVSEIREFLERRGLAQ